jgi:hypothetical protein
MKEGVSGRMGTMRFLLLNCINFESDELYE